MSPEKSRETDQGTALIEIGKIAQRLALKCTLRDPGRPMKGGDAPFRVPPFVFPGDERFFWTSGPVERWEAGRGAVIRRRAVRRQGIVRGIR
ncbi:MAG: hypothetical protein ABR964_04130 [Tepidisphaeraceae bacterium]|jgi:hypothetical protein